MHRVRPAFDLEYMRGKCAASVVFAWILATGVKTYYTYMGAEPECDRWRLSVGLRRKDIDAKRSIPRTSVAGRAGTAPPRFISDHTIVSAMPINMPRHAAAAGATPRIEARPTRTP